MKKEKFIQQPSTTPASTSYLRHDLKKLLIIISVLIVVLIGLMIIDQKTGILVKLAEQLIPKK